MNRKKGKSTVVLAALVLALTLNTGCGILSELPTDQMSDNPVSTEEQTDTAQIQNTETAAGDDEARTTQDMPATENSGNPTEAPAYGAADEDPAGTRHTPDSTPYADAEQYPYYAQLSDNEKIVYQQIVEQVSAGNPDILPEATISGDELNNVVSAVYREQPQLFWLENEWTWYSSAELGIVTSITMKFNTLADQLDESIAAFQAAADAVLQNLDGLTAAEKELAIHDYLAANTAYAQNDFDQNAYSALVGRSSVCCGFTRAFQYLLQRAGIPAYFCQGTADGFSDGENGSDHAWCIVKLGEGYYNVDVTWDETCLAEQGMIIYNYFNRTDEFFSQNHFRDASSEFLPACTATEFSYEALRGMPAELGVTAQMNLDSSEPIESLEAYYEVMRNQIIATGTGTHTFRYIIYGDDCMDQISQAISTNEIQAGFLNDAAAAIGLNGYASSISCQEIDLGSGYHYFVQTIELNAN